VIYRPDLGPSQDCLSDALTGGPGEKLEDAAAILRARERHRREGSTTHLQV